MLLLAGRTRKPDPSTLLRMLATFLPPTSGSASVSGFDLFSQSNAVREIVGYLPEGSPLEPEMGVVEYLRFRGRLRRMPRPRLRRRLHDVVAFCDLAPLRASPIRALSAGQRRAMGLADAILHEPDVLLLDDPLAALDPGQSRKLAAMLAAPEVSDGRVLLFATHDEALVRAVATRVIRLDLGRIAEDTRDVAHFCLDPPSPSPSPAPTPASGHPPLFHFSTLPLFPLFHSP